MPRFPKNKKAPKGAKSDKKHRDDDDDSSVDSHGNIRNLVDYDYEESDEDDDLFEMEEEETRKKSKKSAAAAALAAAVAQRKPRKAAVAARKKIQKSAAQLTRSSEESAEETAVAKKPRRRPMLVVEDESSEEEVAVPKKSKKPLKKKTVVKVAKRKVEKEESEEEEDEDSDEDEDEDEEDEESEEEETASEDDSDEEENAIDIIISDLFGGGGGAGGKDPNKPYKYNLKKEPQNVRRFVELVQKEDEGEEDTIDNDITYFKSLNKEKQMSLLQVLEHKASPAEVQVPLKFKILEKVATNPMLNRIAMAKYTALLSIDPSSTEYYKCSHWITGFTSLPLDTYKELPVKMDDGTEKCHAFMSTVHKCMDRAIYGHDDAKLQIMQFVSSWIANPKAHGNVLSIHGPPGIGKTSIIKDGVAKALDRPFHFVSLGGATDASFLDGHSYTYEGSTWGRIVEILIQSKCMNPVIYFDELDKISETPKGEEIMNLLIHLTDGSQNDRFQDKYFSSIDIDLSRCLFIFSHNNHEKVNPILRDRMYNIECKGFNLKEKLLIAEEYLLPAALKEAGLHEKISISKDILQYVVEDYTGGEAGVRELKRCLQTIVSKVNLLRFYNNPKQVPFAIEGFTLPFTLQKKHVELFLKRKEAMDASIQHLYM